MALHVHASFSEGAGSIASQLECARTSGVDVVWFTEHDWRMEQHNYRTHVSFDGLTGEKEFTKAWTWKAAKVGHPASVSGGIVSSPTSAADPSAIAGALHAAVIASNSSAGDSYFWTPSADPSRHNFRGNISGTVLRIDVCPITVGPDAWGEIRVLLSNHPASGGRPAGRYMLSYRFGVPGTAFAQGFVGVIPVETPAGMWTTVEMDLLSDVRAMWPDLLAEDNSLGTISIGVTGRSGASADVVYDYLRFERAQPTALSPMDLQASMLASYAQLYSDLTMLAGQEVSFMPEHLGWLGGDAFFETYDPVHLQFKVDPASTNQRARALSARGGLVAINHPFGADDSSVVSSTAAVSLLAARYLKYGAYAATMLEVGYAQRGGATLAKHLQLWDILSRNGVYLTGTGVNDSHDGMQAAGGPRSWDLDVNRFTTSVWAPSNAQNDLLAQLRAGSAFCSESTERDLSVSISTDGVAMGSVSVRPDLADRDVVIDARNLPAGYTVALWQGAVDYAASADLTSNTVPVQVISAGDLSSGPLTTQVGCDTSSFVRAVVSNGAGRAVAFSNPLWFLREPSVNAVPVERQAVDSVW